jgi:predicted transcriptional regulator
VRRTEMDEKSENNDSKNESKKYSPSDMRLRMITELQKQEEIFSCVLELSQLEQSHAIQSASQVVQHYLMQNEVENFLFFILFILFIYLFIFLSLL